MDTKYYYLLINIATIFFPVILSFDRKVYFYSRWKFILPSLLITGILYLIWDYIFTVNNVWSFNDDYILGIRLFNLPLEEILFFFTVPFACIFIYECLNAYFKFDIPRKLTMLVSIILLVFSIIMAVMFYNRLYSLINFSTLAFLLLFTLLKNTSLNMGRFYLAYLVSLIPFYMVNGILTAIPIVSYNNTENMGFRVGTIPFEDHFYSMSLFLMNTLLFEYFKNRKLLNGKPARI